jgi:phosphatidate cytidylyltransferase
VTELQQLTAVLVATLALGLGLLGALSVVPPTAARARGLWHLMRAEIVIATAVAAAFLAGTPVLELAVVLVAGRIGFESAHVWCMASSVPAAVRSRLAWIAGLGLALTTAALAFAPAPFNLIAGSCLLAATFVGVVAGTPRPLALRRLSLMGRVATFPGLAVFALALAARTPPTQSALLLAFILTEVFDSFALLGGRLFGRHKIFPRLSPNKTIEGLLSGLAALVVFALVLTTVIAPGRALAGAGATAVAAIVGDLLGSAPKRAAAVKDYPTVMREQGGLLDILDAWLVSGPVLAGLSLLIG